MGEREVHALVSPIIGVMNFVKGLFVVGLGGIVLGAGAQTDVSRAKITDQPASGMIRGKAFFVKTSQIRISASNSIRFKTLPEDRTETFELSLHDDKLFDSKRSVAIRLILDDKERLDGRTFTWRPTKEGTPEDFAQRYPNGSSVGKLTRGVNRVVFYWLPKGFGTYEREEFRDGYSVRLEFGKRKGDFLPGKLAVSTPDKAKSYLVGTFQAELTGRAAD